MFARLISYSNECKGLIAFTKALDVLFGLKSDDASDVMYIYSSVSIFETM